MRAILLSLGLLAAMGAIVDTAARGQTNPPDDGSSNRPQASDDSARAKYESMLHSGGYDRFSAARKMQGSQFYAPSKPSASDNLRSSEAPAWNPSAANNAAPSVGNNNAAKKDSAAGPSNNSSNRSESGTTNSNMPKPASLFGNVIPNTASPSSRSQFIQPSDSGGTAIDDSNNSGLNALQQRLAKMRKSASDGATSMPDVRPPVAAMAESGVPTPAVPSASSIMAQRLSTVGPQNGPSAPAMPELHRSAAPPISSDTAQIIENPTINATSPTSTTSSKTAAVSALPGPVVGGPLTASRQEDAAIQSQEMGRVPVVGQMPIANQEFTAGPAPAKTAFGAPQDFHNGNPNGDVSMKSYASQTINPMADVGQSISAPARATGRATDDVLFAKESPLMGIETLGPRSITVGKEATYTVVITNAGEFAAQDVVVSISIPEWAEVVAAKSNSGTSAAVPEQPGEPIVWRLPRLESRSKEQLIVRLIPHESRPFDLSVQWTSSPAASQAMVEVKEPKLALSLDGPPEVIYGQSKVYRLTISNPGTGDAEKVVLMLAPVDGGSEPPTRHEVGLIRAGESKPIEMELSPRQIGTLTINAVAVAEGNIRAEVNEEILVRRPALKLTASGPDTKYAGTVGTYSISIANPGNATARNISVAALLPAGSKYVSSAGGLFEESENKVVWNIASLRPGGEQNFELRCAMSTPGANRLQIVGTAASDLHDSVAAVTEVQSVADLKLEVVDPPGPLAVGDDMVYEVHIRNRGTKAAEKVDVVGFFSRGLEPIVAQGAEHEIAPGQIVFKPIDSIPPASEVVLKIKARADQAGHHIFRAEVNCPAAGAKLASEETTLFYGDEHEAARTAARPNSKSGRSGQPSSSDVNSQPPVKR